MDWLKLPEPDRRVAAAFTDPAGARAWIASQPQAQPLAMLAALDAQVRAVDGADLPPDSAGELLGILRATAVPLLAASETRYLRKALPLLPDDQRAFEAARQLWRDLGIAHLRLAAELPGEHAAPLLHRAAGSLRMAQYVHFQAAQACPAELDRLLLGILGLAGRLGVLDVTLTDPDFVPIGPGHIGGLLAWALLLRRIDPYRLSAPQLVVANRAIRRWRELCEFQAAPSSRVDVVELAALFPEPPPDDVPGYLEIHRLRRKIRQRLAALEAGDTPESLKLGRELSGAACIRLLHDLDRAFRPSGPATPAVDGELELVFGCDDAYALFAGRELNRPASETRPSAIAHQRMAIFGFDRPSELPDAARKPQLATERWLQRGGEQHRPAMPAGPRRLSPCLVAATLPDGAALGVLQGLHCDAGGALRGTVRWYPGRIRAAAFLPPSGGTQRAAAFVINDGKQASLLVPASAGTRIDSPLRLEEETAPRRLGEVLERGADFVRYALEANGDAG